MAHAFLPPPRHSSGAAILFIHGWESDQRSYRARAERACSEGGATCLTFDLSGHGESGDHPASFTLRDHLVDSIAAFDHLARLSAVDNRRIGVCGASYGGYLAASLIKHRPVEALLLRAPALYPDPMIDLAVLTRPTRLVPLGEATPLENLGAFNGPVLIVESERDEVIPPPVIDSYLSASLSPSHVVLRDASHALTNPSWNEAFIEALLNWCRML